jgi:hypothetical protein
MVESG